MTRIIYLTAKGILFASHLLSIYFSILRIYHNEEKSEDIGRSANCSLLRLHPPLKSTTDATLLKSWNTYIFRDKDRNMYFCLEYFWNLFPILVPWSFALALVRPLVKVANWQSWYKSQRPQKYLQTSGMQNETSKCFAPHLAHYCKTGYLWTAFAW